MSKESSEQLGETPASKDEMLRQTWRMSQVTYRAVLGDPNDPVKYPGLIHLVRELAEEIHGNRETRRIGIKEIQENHNSKIEMIILWGKRVCWTAGTVSGIATVGWWFVKNVLLN